MLEWRKRLTKKVFGEEWARVNERERKREGGGFSSFLSLKDRADCSLLSVAPQAEEESTGNIHISLSRYSICHTHPCTYPSLSLQVITPFRRLILCAENRKEMEDWISSLKSVQSREHYEVSNQQIHASLCVCVCVYMYVASVSRGRWEVIRDNAVGTIDLWWGVSSFGAFFPWIVQRADVPISECTMIV